MALVEKEIWRLRETGIVTMRLPTAMHNPCRGRADLGMMRLLAFALSAILHLLRIIVVTWLYAPLCIAPQDEDSIVRSNSQGN